MVYDHRHLKNVITHSRFCKVAFPGLSVFIQNPLLQMPNAACFSLNPPFVSKNKDQIMNQYNPGIKSAISQRSWGGGVTGVILLIRCLWVWQMYSHVELQLSLAGAAASIIFVATNVLLQRTQDTSFVTTKICLLQRNYVCHNRIFLAPQAYFCHDKRRVLS